MRSRQEANHSACRDVFAEVEGWAIFYVVPGPDRDDGTAAGEFALFGEDCLHDPLILTADELRRLGRQLIDLAGFPKPPAP